MASLVAAGVEGDLADADDRLALGLQILVDPRGGVNRCLLDVVLEDDGCGVGQSRHDILVRHARVTVLPVLAVDLPLHDRHAVLLGDLVNGVVVGAVRRTEEQWGGTRELLDEPGVVL